MLPCLLSTWLAGSDIDTLCVSPKHVKREDFFSKMYEMLKARSEVTEITAVSDAYVPVIKFQFSEIPVGLIRSKLSCHVKLTDPSVDRFGICSIG